MAWKAYDSGGAELSRSVTDLPVGTVVGNARSSAPTGWLNCDGSAISRTGYPDLYSAIGTSYGTGDGSTTFNLPNSDGNMILAVSAAEKFGINDGSNIINSSITSAKLAPGATSASFVTSLPSSPVDGQIVFYQSSTAGTGGGTTSSMATVGAVWQLRYNASSSSAYKWEFVGGTTIFHHIDTYESLGAGVATYSDLATVGPRVKAPLAGEYSILIGAGFKHNVSGGVAYMSYSAGVTAAGSGEEIALQYAWQSFVSNNTGIQSTRRSIKAIEANGEFIAKYRNNDGSPANNPIASFDKRRMELVPIRVSA